MLGAVVYGHEQMRAAIDAIHELVDAAGKPAWDWQAPATNQPLVDQINLLAEADVRAAFQIRAKQERNDRLNAIRKGVITTLAQSVSGIKPILTSSFSGLSEPCA